MSPKPLNLQKLSIDKLSKLRDQVDVVINEKVAEERRTVQHKLGNLDRLVANGVRVKGVRGGVGGTVPAKYRNPENPAETWAGRGLKPRWLAAALEAGKMLEDFSVEASSKKPQGRAEKGRS
jgi:DNA-binding protein H-NS